MQETQQEDLSSKIKKRTVPKTQQRALRAIFGADSFASAAYPMGKVHIFVPLEEVEKINFRDWQERLRSVCGITTIRKEWSRPVSFQPSYNKCKKCKKYYNNIFKKVS